MACRGRIHRGAKGYVAVRCCVPSTPPTHFARPGQDMAMVCPTPPCHATRRGGACHDATLLSLNWPFSFRLPGPRGAPGWDVTVVPSQTQPTHPAHATRHDATRPDGTQFASTNPTHFTMPHDGAKQGRCEVTLPPPDKPSLFHHITPHAIPSHPITPPPPPPPPSVTRLGDKGGEYPTPTRPRPIGPDWTELGGLGTTHWNGLG
jgi:hypothetical protein